MAESTQQPSDVASDYATTRFIIEALLSRVSTCTLVRVVACTNEGGLSPVGTVDVQPLVNQIAGDGSAWPHGRLYKLPYCRAQGGVNAVILDPQPGDLGLVVFASRDISAIKSAAGKAQAADAATRGLNPGSKRQYDMSDGLYIGGLLNGTPEQFVRFSATGLELVSPAKITLTAPTIELMGDVVQTDGDASFENDVAVGATLTAATDVVGGGIHLKTHTHGGVTAGGGNTAPPNP